MHTDQIYIARDGKSGMHVLVRILAVDDIGVDYPPIDPNNFNKLMMARDVKSLVLAARDLGPMYISADILSRRTFIPSHLQQDIECGFNLIPPNLESLLSECYFDPYAIPDEIAGMGYRAIGRTGKKATRELINELDFTKAGDLSYLDSQFRAIVEPLHDWVFARNQLSLQPKQVCRCLGNLGASKFYFHGNPGSIAPVNHGIDFEIIGVVVMGYR